MEQFKNGTSAINMSFAETASWHLRRTGGADQISSYELWPEKAADTDAPGVMLRVISGLLDGMHVGVMAESERCDALPSLGRIWRDGRMLKGRGNCAFVALDQAFGEIQSEDIASCVDAGAAFRFVGFDGNAPEDMVFRSLLEGDSDAAIELSCSGFADGVLSIRFDGEKVDEKTALGGISEAIGHLGRNLKIDI